MVKFVKRNKKEKYMPVEPLEIWLRIISRISLYSLLLFFVFGIGAGILFVGVLKVQFPTIVTYILIVLFMLFLMTMIPAIFWFWHGRKYSRSKLTESLFKNEKE